MKRFTFPFEFLVAPPTLRKSADPFTETRLVAVWGIRETGQ